MSVDPGIFREKILDQIASLVDQDAQAQAGTDTVELDQTRVGRLSRMDALQIQQMNLATTRRREQLVASLNRALARLDDGSYGECFECGEDINPKRLEVDLTAQYCIKCAEVRECSQ